MSQTPASGLMPNISCSFVGRVAAAEFSRAFKDPAKITSPLRGAKNMRHWASRLPFRPNHSDFETPLRSCRTDQNRLDVENVIHPEYTSSRS